MNLKIAIIQMEIKDGKKEENITNALSILESLTKEEKKPDIVCFPELFTTGFDLKNINNYAEEFSGESFNRISKISKNNFLVIGSILENEKQKFYNTAFIIGKNGDILGKYRKIHLFAPMLEKQYLTPGELIQIFNIPELNNMKLGLAICYDIRFPGLFRKMALEGAQIIFIPSEFPSPKNDIWRTLIMARAIENQLFIVGINRVGKGDSNHFFGNSIITNGNSHHILGSNQEIKIIEINLHDLIEIKSQLSILDDCRFDLYKL